MSVGAIKAGRAFVSIEAIDNTARVLRKAQANLSTYASNVQSLGKRLTAATALASAPFAFSLSTFAGFDDQMRKVKAVSQSSEAEFLALTNQAKELGRTTSFTAKEVGELQTELGKAGFKAPEIQQQTPHVLNLSRGTDTPTSTAAGIVAASLRQFDLAASETERVADGLTQTANGTFNSVESIGESMKYVGPIAHQFNMTFEETLALTGALGNIGIQGSMAGTVLRNLQLRAASLPDEFSAIGVTTKDASGNLRNLIDILADVDKATKSLGTGDRIEVLNKLFGIRAVTGGAALSGNKGGIDELLKSIQGASGVSKQTAADMDAGIGGAFRRFTSALEGVNIAMGDATQWVGKFLDQAANVMTSLTPWIAANKELISSLVVLLTTGLALGASLVALGIAVKLIATAFTPFHLALGLLKPLLVFLPNLIGLIFSPLGALSVAVLAIGTPLMIVVWQWREVWGALVALTGDAVAGIISGLQFGMGMVQSNLGDIAGFFGSVFASIAGFIPWLEQVMSTHILGRFVLYAREDLFRLNSFLLSSLMSIPGIISSVFRFMGGLVLWGISLLVNGPLGQLAGLLLQGVAQILRIMAMPLTFVLSMVGRLLGFIAQTVGQILSIMATPVFFLMSLYGKFLMFVLQQFVSLVSIITSPITTLLSWVGSFIAGLVGDLGSLIGMIATGIGQSFGLVQGLFGYLLSVGPATLSTLGEAWSGAMGAFNGFLTQIGESFSMAWSGIIQRIMSGDLAGAAQIALAGLKSIWAEALSAMQLLWISFKQEIATAWIGLSDQIGMAMIQVQTKVLGFAIDMAGQEGPLGALARTAFGMDTRGAAGDFARMGLDMLTGAKERQQEKETSGSMTVLMEDIDRERKAARAPADQAMAELSALMDKPPEEQVKALSPPTALAGEKVRELANNASAPAMQKTQSLVSTTLPDALEKGTVEAAKQAHENKSNELLSSLVDETKGTNAGIDDMNTKLGDILLKFAE